MSHVAGIVIQLWGNNVVSVRSLTNCRIIIIIIIIIIINATSVPQAGPQLKLGGTRLPVSNALMPLVTETLDRDLTSQCSYDTYVCMLLMSVLITMLDVHYFCWTVSCFVSPSTMLFCCILYRYSVRPVRPIQTSIAVHSNTVTSRVCCMHDMIKETKSDSCYN